MEGHVNLTVYRIVFVKKNEYFSILCSIKETKKKNSS